VRVTGEFNVLFHTSLANFILIGQSQHSAAICFGMKTMKVNLYSTFNNSYCFKAALEKIMKLMFIS